MKQSATDKELIETSLKNDREAQKLLYKRYASRVYGICLRFAKTNTEADDILQEAFIKVFMNLQKFRFGGSFEGWVKRIVVNTAIDYLKKNTVITSEYNENIDENCNITENEVITRLSVDDLMKIIQTLPDSKRLIFNLYAYEGYSHKEIAAMLGISVMTSKSQYCKAKKILQEHLNNIKNFSYERVQQG